MSRLEMIREREKAATKGPWRDGSGDRFYEPTSIVCHVDADPNPSRERILFRGNAHFPCAWDVAFVTHARADIPHLLALVDDLKGALAARCDGCACGHPRLIRYGEDGHDYGGGFWQACDLRANERAALVKTEA